MIFKSQTSPIPNTIRFLGVPFTKQTFNKARKAMKEAPMPSTSQNRKVDIEKVRAVARNVTSCISVLAQFGYE